MVAHRNLIAIDPGAISGAFALFQDGVPFHVGDLAVVNKQLDAAALSRILREMRVDIAVVEEVHSMPRQGVASSFKFGYACGVIYGVIAANEIPLHYVRPQKWQKHFGLIGKDKEASRALAIRLFPALSGLTLKRNQGRAEAVLMGQWHLSEEKRQ